jgi:hypothetical protein
MRVSITRKRSFDKRVSMVGLLASLSVELIIAVGLLTVSVPAVRLNLTPLQIIALSKCQLQIVQSSRK